MPGLSGITHESVKRCMPPGAFLWKHNSQGTWNSRMPPLHVCSRSWRKYGERIALALCIQAAWRDYCILEGNPEADCPLQQVLDQDFCVEEQGEPSQAAGAGSSRS